MRLFLLVLTLPPRDSVLTVQCLAFWRLREASAGTVVEVLVFTRRKVAQLSGANNGRSSTQAAVKGARLELQSLVLKNRVGKGEQPGGFIR